MFEGLKLKTESHSETSAVPEHMTGAEKGYLSPEEDNDAALLEFYESSLNDSNIPESERDVRRNLIELTRKYMKEARVDMLTEIPNRRALNEEFSRLDRVFNRQEREGTETGNFYVLAFDLDGFKQLNDNFGHEAGDECLRLVGSEISSDLRASDYFAREGGDEFIITLSDTDADGARNIAEKVMKKLEAVTAKLRSKYAAEEDFEKINISASVGMVRREVGETPEQLLKKADYTRYAVKAAGKSGILTFDEARELDGDGAIYHNFSDGMPVSR